MTNNTKLWVDDERPAPDDTWDVATNTQEAYGMLTSTIYDVVSLDYVLTGWESGYDVAEFMHERHRWPREELRLHSGSSTGRYQIGKFAMDNAPKTLRITDAPVG